ncbi:39S ribosomal protein L50, mitochondrial isoform X2 [Orussus abietinus]|uniref:39S ribosomal protein L50, mitochondrial isoform X2 n=1 Tax=Orussus abietinus TaxID=222816 RepID=UPI0006253446|nr:39S ribosomal protein L50, mitochondrial isoform X2 [Orussus abietinus]
MLWFLRPYKPYTPPCDVLTKINEICKALGVPIKNDFGLKDPILRFKFFVACEKEFNHSIPNSLLYTIETIRDVREYYLTPVDSVTPLETLKRIDLPKNLHINYEYHRFHPETDTKFNGKTAFPASSTVITGLKYKKKYSGHVQKTSWP